MTTSNKSRSDSDQKSVVEHMFSVLFDPISHGFLYMSVSFYFTESKRIISGACVPMFTILGILFALLEI